MKHYDRDIKLNVITLQCNNKAMRRSVNHCGGLNVEPEWQVKSSLGTFIPMSHNSLL